jgi:Antitoxin VbhA
MLLHRNLNCVILLNTLEKSMDDITKRTPKPRIDAEEMTRRREALRRADAHNRIEGILPDPESEPIFQAFVRGDIEFEDILPRLNALLPPS